VNSTIDIGRITETMRLSLNKEILSEIRNNPVARVLNLDNLSTKDVMLFIRSFHSSEFARHSVADTKSLTQVAEWFIELIGKLYDFMAVNKSD
jgi:hypothetical protein